MGKLLNKLFTHLFVFLYIFIYIYKKTIFMEAIYNLNLNLFSRNTIANRQKVFDTIHSFLNKKELKNFKPSVSKESAIYSIPTLVIDFSKKNNLTILNERYFIKEATLRNKWKFFLVFDNETKEKRIIHCSSSNVKFLNPNNNTIQVLIEAYKFYVINSINPIERMRKIKEIDNFYYTTFSKAKYMIEETDSSVSCMKILKHKYKNNTSFIYYNCSLISIHAHNNLNNLSNIFISESSNVMHKISLDETNIKNCIFFNDEKECMQIFKQKFENMKNLTFNSLVQKLLT